MSCKKTEAVCVSPRERRLFAGRSFTRPWWLRPVWRWERRQSCWICTRQLGAMFFLRCRCGFFVYADFRIQQYPLVAAARVFFFCGGMLSAYYVTAELTASVYAMQFVWGWFLFSLICAVLAFVLWYGRGSGWVSYVIGTGVILIMLALAVILFDKIRVADLIFAALTGVVLFRKQPLAGK